MKAEILSFSGYDTPVIDLTHMVEPGNILQGAYHLRSSLPHLPEGSVTLAVVDPGVGSERSGLAVFWQGRFVVAPDNGLITMLNGPLKAWKLPPPEPGSSTVFHGRDLFARCAARIAVDPGWTSYLDPLDPVFLEEQKPVFNGSILSVAVLHVDHFGNCILGVSSEDMKGAAPVALVSDLCETPLFPVSSYHQAPADDTLLFLQGSQGFYELALNGRSASEKLDLLPGHRISINVKRTNIL